MSNFFFVRATEIQSRFFSLLVPGPSCHIVTQGMALFSFWMVDCLCLSYAVCLCRSSSLFSVSARVFLSLCSFLSTCRILTPLLLALLSPCKQKQGLLLPFSFLLGRSCCLKSLSLVRVTVHMWIASTRLLLSSQSSQALNRCDRYADVRHKTLSQNLSCGCIIAALSWLHWKRKRHVGDSRAANLAALVSLGETPPEIQKGAIRI